jgi:hypothetical protein
MHEMEDLMCRRREKSSKFQRKFKVVIVIAIGYKNNPDVLAEEFRSRSIEKKSH